MIVLVNFPQNFNISKNLTKGCVLFGSTLSGVSTGLVTAFVLHYLSKAVFSACVLVLDRWRSSGREDIFAFRLG